jgi:hypothetical protein
MTNGHDAAHSLLIAAAGTAHIGNLGMVTCTGIGSIGTAGIIGSELLLHDRIRSILAGGRGVTLAAGTAHICDCLMLACTRLSGIGTTGIVGLELCHHFRILSILAIGRGSWSLGSWSLGSWSLDSSTPAAGTAHAGDLGMLARACIGSIVTAGLRGSKLFLHD